MSESILLIAPSSTSTIYVTTLALGYAIALGLQKCDRHFLNHVDPGLLWVGA
ncbi:MAG: hypothetical protein HEQ35_08635 [Gloeotrichia echinulata IR180]|nr:hypothetical protein [Gloeotrichia echinulata DEX184]